MNDRQNKYTKVYRSQYGQHQRVSSAITAARERRGCTPLPINYALQVPTDMATTMVERHNEFRHQQELNKWQSRYNFLQKNYDAQKEQLSELNASHERLKK